MNQLGSRMMIAKGQERMLWQKVVALLVVATIDKY